MEDIKKYFLNSSTGIILFFIGFWLFSFSLFYEINDNYVWISTLLFSFWFHIKLQMILLRNSQYKKIIDILVYVIYGYWFNLFHKYLNK